MFNVNGWELIVIAVIVFLVLGPDRLPEFMLRAGELLRRLRQATDEATAELTRELRAATDLAQREAGGPGSAATAKTSAGPDAGPSTGNPGQSVDEAADLGTLAPPVLFPPLTPAPTVEESRPGDAAATPQVTGGGHDVG